VNSSNCPLKDVAQREWSAGLFSGCAIGQATAEDLKTPLLCGTRNGVEGNWLSERDLFDAASLTKSVVTATLALLALQRGMAELEEPIVKRLPELMTKYREEVLLRHLLTQTLDYRVSLSSLKKESPQKIIETLLYWPFEYRPGDSFLYCNATSMLLGLWLERVWRGAIDQIAEREIFHPLEMNSSTFHPLQKRKVEEIVPSEIDSWRGGMVRGEVHDESAWTMMKAGNRVVGSAGLFLSIGDLQLYMQELLRAKRGEGKILTSGTIELVNRNWMGALPGEVALGFERNQPAWMGSHSSRQTIGKTGFTGCSFVVDFERERAVAILSNCTWPQRKPRERIDRFRANIADSSFDSSLF